MASLTRLNRRLLRWDRYSGRYDRYGEQAVTTKFAEAHLRLFDAVSCERVRRNLTPLRETSR